MGEPGAWLYKTVVIGVATEKATAFDGALFPGLRTVTWAVSAFVRFAAGTSAVNCEFDMKVVLRGAPFQRTVAPGRKPVPWTVRVNPVCPGETAAGTSGCATNGTGFCAKAWANAHNPYTR
jgi:hypothetical protein